MLVVVALGGNALLRRGEPLDIESQRHNVQHAGEVLSDLARDHALVVTHTKAQAIYQRGGWKLDTALLHYEYELPKKGH